MMDSQFEIVRFNIENRLKDYLDRAGMYYRIFSRAKKEDSIINKLRIKADDYRRDGKKMQDLIGVRIIFYFSDDIVTFHEKLKQLPGYDPNNESNSTKELKELSDFITSLTDDDLHIKKQLKTLLPLNDKVFMPERLNVVMEMDNHEKSLTKMELDTNTEYDGSLVDSTYEIQLRTVLSEGWHEVEHDLRYKTKDEMWWDYCGKESRILNGLYASLITSEESLARMIEEITYKNYRNHSWDAMIRFHFRRRTTGDKLSSAIVDILNADDGLAKSLLQIQRAELVGWLWEIVPPFSISTDFIFFLINRRKFHREDIINLEPMPIKAVLDNAQFQA